MTKKRGRPTRPTLGIWQNPDVLTRRVRTMVRRRDKDDEQTVTEVGQQLIGLTGRVLPRPLTTTERARLLRLAHNAKPSQVTTTLLRWRFQLPDRAVRVLLRRKGIMKMRWA
jgi:hypothetical protein